MYFSESSGIRESAPPPFHLSALSGFHKNTITQATVLDSSLPPAIVNLFISCTNPSSNLDPHLSQGKVQAIPQLASFLRVSTQLHMGLAFMSHMIDIYTTQIPLYNTDCFWGEDGETGRQQEAQFKCKQKVMIYNFQETVSELEEFTHCHDIKASKVKEMYTHKILKGNLSYFKLNKVSHNASKRHVILPWHAVWMMWTCGQCGGADSRNTERPCTFYLWHGNNGKPWQDLFWAYSRIWFSNQKNTWNESSTWLLNSTENLKVSGEDLSELFGVTEWPYLSDHWCKGQG